MDFMSPILDIGICLRDCSAKRIVYVHDLEKNITTLNNALKELKSLSEDVKGRVEVSERQNLLCTNQVKDWLEQVEVTEQEVNQTLQKGNEEIQKKCLGCCPRNCWSSYKLGKVVAKKLAAVETLVKKGQFETFATKLPRGPVDEMPIEKTVGLDRTLSKVWECIQSKSIGIIGLYGMGGVGKTTLLKRINNEFFGKQNDFDAIIWVVVSKEASVMKIQDAIRSRLQIPDDVWNANNVEDRSIEIYKTLRGKKFVLLLDDLWQRFDLLKVGVPLPDIHSGSKVIFSTRSEEVCGQMEADRCIRVECLDQDMALDLFLDKVGQEALNIHPNILRLAKVVAEECKGLPLALITIGRSMASRKTLEDWERGVELLRSYPSKFSGVVDYVYQLLEFSYDNLPSATFRSCFLSFSLFPKGYNMSKSGVIDLWIGEGLLDELDDIHDARRQGKEIIETLKLACLLESGDLEGFVKMHDVVRDMAMWLACERGKKMNKFLVRESIWPNKVAKWKDAERITLWGREICSLSGMLFSPKAVTLRVTGTSLITIPCEFLKFMPSLVTLDLSGNGKLNSLPEGIDNLKNLQYLNLSRTALREFPVEIRNLKKLRCLLLNDTYRLVDIPREVIASLSSLQVFSRLQNPSRMEFNPEYDEMGLLDMLESLGHIDDICITITNSFSLQKIFKCSKLQQCIRNLTILWSFISLDVSTWSLSKIEHLEALEIWNANPLRISVGKQRMQDSLSTSYIQDNSSFSGLEQMRNLSILVVVQCEMLDMTWLIHVPRLRTLRISDCRSIREVLDGDIDNEFEHGNPSAFSCLVTLQLQDLPRLESIATRQRGLGFPLLKEIQVLNCPSLMKLPFDSNTAKLSTLKEIRGQRGWWDKLSWDDENVKNVFTPKFVSLDGIASGCEETLPILFLPVETLPLIDFRKVQETS